MKNILMSVCAFSLLILLLTSIGFSMEDNRKVLITAKPNQICTPGEGECGWGANLNKIVICNAQGTGYITSTDCTHMNMVCMWKNEGTVPYCRMQNESSNFDIFALFLFIIGIVGLSSLIYLIGKFMHKMSKYDLTIEKRKH